MQPLTDYRAASRLVMAQLRPGVLTNNFMTKADYQREIAAGTLFYQEFAGGLLLFCRRDGFSKFYYYLQDAAILPPLPDNEVLMAEQVCPPHSGNAAGSWLERQGFAPCLRRIRLAREAGAFPNSGTARPAYPEEAAQIDALLRASFDARTGCLPSESELQAAIAAGQMLCTTAPDGSVTGVLHHRPARGATELRHLAVAPAWRRQHLAQALFSCYMAQTAGQKSLVWVREDNAPALGFYTHCGYRPDGWSAQVYEKG